MGGNGGGGGGHGSGFLSPPRGAFASIARRQWKGQSLFKIDICKLWRRVWEVYGGGGRRMLLMQQCGTSPNFIFSLKSLPLFSIRAPETRRNKTSTALRRWEVKPEGSRGGGGVGGVGVKRGCVNFFFFPIPKREGGSWRSLQHPPSVRRHPGANTPAHHNQLPIVATCCKLHNSRHKKGRGGGGG